MTSSFTLDPRSGDESMYSYSSASEQHTSVQTYAVHIQTA